MLSGITKCAKHFRGVTLPKVVQIVQAVKNVKQAFYSRQFYGAELVERKTSLAERFLCFF